MDFISHLTPPRAVRREDIPEEYLDIVDAIGMPAFITLTMLCGGQNLYIPMRESLERDARNRDILARFNGSNTRTLAVEFRLSERQIRKIIHGDYS
jgi:Mor family transcriptional regulator